MWTFLVCICAVAASAASQSVESRIVTTDHGPVRGYKDQDGTVFSFYDVPYATAPNGRNRFKAPLPPPVFTEPFEAVYRDIACPQLHDVFPGMKIQEDCLVANIFVPDTNATNLTVAVNVHGGGFQVRHSNFVQIKNFARNNRIIVVTFNYRLAAYGFLCLGTEGAPGNAGMKDQVALLRWVNRNIAQFGGNPEDVTIMGCSAGGISVDLLTLSNTTTGLFNKVIPESGCAYGAIGVQSDPIANAKYYARMLNFTNVDDLQALEEFYMTTPYQTLALHQNYVMERPDSGIIFAPCIERDVGVEMFLTDDPANILKNGDFPNIPMLYGLADKEGLFRMSYYYDWIDIMNRNFSDCLPTDLEFESAEQKAEVARTVKSFYFGDGPVTPSEQSVLGFVDYYTDTLFGYRMMKEFTLRLGAKQQSIYLFMYSFVDENTEVIPYTRNATGSNHCEQTFAIYDEDKTNLTEAYKNMKETLRTLWTNFIFTGKPVPEGSSLPSWPAANITRSPYMSIGTTIELRNLMFEERFRLWDDIYEKHYRIPIPPRPMPGSVAGITSNVFFGPIPPPVFTEPFEAVHRDIACPQLHDVYPGMKIQEDCLVANIFVPNTNATNLTVAGNVHGGGFQVRHSGFVQIKNFARNNRIIIVTFNYRLGAYGFLCLGTEGAPGNTGMKDQVALLRWVNRNIAQFGGNPEDVTIMGCSAGGISVDLLTLSNTTTGLFNKVIPESGCAYGAIGVQRDPIENAKYYARLLNFTNVNDLQALEEFYLTAPYQTLALNQNHIKESPDSGFIFAPCLERDVGVEMFLTDDPANILKNGDFPDIPMLYGLANKEGLFRMPFFYDWSDMMNRNFSDCLPADLEFESGDQKTEVARTVKLFYFGDGPVTASEQSVLGFVDYYTDTLFGYRMMKEFTLRLGAKQQSIYLFMYSFVDENTEVIPYTRNATGSNHCELTFDIYDEEKTNETEAYKNMKETLRTLWTNFIFTGNPAPEGSSLPSWPAANITRSPYLSIGTKIELRNLMFEERFRLWDDIYEKHYRIPIPPRPMPGSVAGITSNIFFVSFIVICNLVSRFLFD